LRKRPVRSGRVEVSFELKLRAPRQTDLKQTKSLESYRIEFAKRLDGELRAVVANARGEVVASDCQQERRAGLAPGTEVVLTFGFAWIAAVGVDAIRGRSRKRRAEEAEEARRRELERLQARQRQLEEEQRQLVRQVVNMLKQTYDVQWLGDITVVVSPGDEDVKTPAGPEEPIAERTGARE
jgi:hypothetical protein